MIEWRCLVLSADGGRDWRRVYASSERQATLILLDEGLTPLEVRSGKLSLGERLAQPMGNSGGIGISNQALILTQLAMLLKAGMPIDRSLDLLREQMPRAVQRNYLAEVLTRVRSGEGLAKALACRVVFPDYVTGVIGAAEQAGALDRALAMLSERMSELASARRDLVTALAYPAAVLAATLIALIIVVTIVIPQFEPLFVGEEARLPSLTRLVLALSELLHDYGAWLLLGLASLSVALMLWLRSPSGHRTMTARPNLVPGLALRDQYLAARFATILGTLLGNGVTIVRALPLVRAALSSRRWRSYCLAIETRLREGETLAAALARDGLLPHAAIRLAEVGERSGKLAAAMGEAGRIMHASAKARTDRIVALANPIAIVGLGGLVAMLVGGVMLGIFALGEFSG
jgi:type II secretory pathway component PulF